MFFRSLNDLGMDTTVANGELLFDLFATLVE
ncbi:hypothetical protein AF72_06390 [Xylella taiwanensis]|uniref:Uncharacterized protein n=1 Tax=Xylella taiwanensis TaxID=1444770 RepID=Z9JKJ4_9GAMM|nr:hypothetical protein AF72_06390 [Xylella taiwanensis]